MSTEINSRIIYPSPFEPKGIEFELSAEGFITLKILDDNGNEVETLIENKLYNVGKQLIPIEYNKYSGGKYWYKISVNIGGKEFYETKQIG